MIIVPDILVDIYSRILLEINICSMPSYIKKFIIDFMEVVEIHTYYKGNNVDKIIKYDELYDLYLYDFDNEDIKVLLRMAYNAMIKFVEYDLRKYKIKQSIQESLKLKTENLLQSLIDRTNKIYKFAIKISNPYVQSAENHKKYDTLWQFGYKLDDLGKVIVIIYDMNDSFVSPLAIEYENYNHLNKFLSNYANRYAEKNPHIPDEWWQENSDIPVVWIEGDKDYTGSPQYYSRNNIHPNISLRWLMETCYMNPDRDPLGHITFEHAACIGKKIDLTLCHYILFKQLIDEYELALNTKCEIIWQ